MACNCIEEREENLRESMGDDEAFISAVMDFTTKQRRFCAKGYYRGKLFGKIFKKNFSLCYLAFDYCPFCGKKYKESNNG